MEKNQIYRNNSSYMECGKKSSSVGSEKMERVGDR